MLRNRIVSLFLDTFNEKESVHPWVAVSQGKAKLKTKDLHIVEKEDRNQNCLANMLDQRDDFGVISHIEFGGV
jgi:hypothetical protein